MVRRALALPLVRRALELERALERARRPLELPERRGSLATQAALGTLLPQIPGRKRWHLHPTMTRKPAPRMPEPSPEPSSWS